jgi:holo-[acyl-carrier protein] synthase
LGLDVVEVARITRAMENPRFAERILTPAERERPLTPLYVAGRWAAKEAVAKAIMASGGPVPTWQQVSILNLPGGAPQVHLDTSLNLPAWRWHVSLSHERGLAVAVAVCEG